jgi:hypothetical protein
MAFGITDNPASREFMFTITGEAIIGGLAATAFTSINPIGGAIFGLASGITYAFIDSGNIECLENYECFKTFRIAFAFFTSVVIGAAVAGVVGFPLTLSAGLVLTASMVAVNTIISLLFRLCFQAQQVTEGCVTNQLPPPISQAT